MIPLEPGARLFVPALHTPGKSFKSSSATSSVWFIAWLAAQKKEKKKKKKAPGFLVYCVQKLDLCLFSFFGNNQIREVNWKHWGADEAVLLKCARRSQRKIVEPCSAAVGQEEKQSTFGYLMIFLHQPAWQAWRKCLWCLSGRPLCPPHVVWLVISHLFPFIHGFQVERAPRKHVVEEFEEFDYSDLYDDMSVSTVTAGPNVTEYEVRLKQA